MVNTGSGRASMRIIVNSSAATAIGGLALALFFHINNPYRVQIFPACGWRLLTGHECIGCGGTRSLYSLLHGDIVTSIEMNPLVLAIVVSWIAFVAYWTVESQGRRGIAKVLRWIAVGTPIITALIVGVMRAIQ